MPPVKYGHPGITIVDPANQKYELQVEIADAS